MMMFVMLANDANPLYTAPNAENYRARHQADSHP
jgi:hypothetical protein